MNSEISKRIFHAQIAPDTYLLSSSLSGPNDDSYSLAPGRATANGTSTKNRTVS